VSDFSSGAVEEMLAIHGSIPASPTIVTLASGLGNLGGVTIDGSGDVFVANYHGGQIYKIVAVNGRMPASPVIKTIATDVLESSGIAADAAGNIFLPADGGGFVEEIVAAGGYTRSRLIGSGFAYPFGVAVDGRGDVIVGDIVNGAVDFLDYADAPALNFRGTAVGSTSNPLTVSVSNEGNASLVSTILTIGTNASSFNFTDNCASLSAGEQCNIRAQFAPTAGGALTGQLWIIDNDFAVSNAHINLSGAGLTAATLASPGPGSTLTGRTVTFSWATAAGIEQYSLHVGTQGVGSSDIYGEATTGGSETVEGIPTTAGTLYVRLYTLINGTWESNDYTYTEEGPNALASMSSPTSGSALTGPTATFSWTPGAVVTQYSLHVGTEGVGSSNIFEGATTGLSLGVTGIPTTGGTLYVRLYSLIDAAWQYNDYTYVEAAPAAAIMTSALPGSSVQGLSAYFQWTTGTLVTQYDLHVGTTGAGSSNIFGGGVTGQSQTVTGVPLGSTVYVRLYSFINGAWQYKDYTYVFTLLS
jgi:hypothetical protein